ncbi:hypothetical protein RUM43_005918 [Polyplax serrata]|uniref:Gamma-glutamyltransferase n=1 Tax=Polyplax serrata TaxID=468196 RepID=A0AAN8PE63_POLSC
MNFSSLINSLAEDILKKNGSAVDAAIATLFCNGVVNCQSMGLGGGFQMTIYEKKTGKAYTLNAREMAPSSVTEEMYRFDKSLSKAGALAVAVPGELAGYWAAHQRFGRLPWREVVEPTLKICQYGYNMTQHQYTSLSFRPDLIKKDDLFRELFINATTGEFHPPGTLIIQKRICKTLEIIAKEGGSTLYNGSLSKAFVDDIKSIGGIITLEDMKNYRVQWDDPVVLKLSQGITLYSVPPPGSGTILALILNILDGYNFNETSISSIERAILTDHRIVEAFKFAFAKRTELGDPEFLPTNLIIKNSTDEVTGDILRSIINDDVTFQEPEHYGAFSSNREDHGTAHVSVISPEGDAVSVTSTVNM